MVSLERGPNDVCERMAREARKERKAVKEAEVNRKCQNEAKDRVPAATPIGALPKAPLEILMAKAIKRPRKQKEARVAGLAAARDSGRAMARG
jgi:hypothetical protein